MKRIISLLSIVIIGFTLVACSQREKLLLLNWGEYISDDVVAKFEETYNCDVVISLADSNELFYSKIKSGTTVYDLVVPSDYMVEKMYKNDLLQEVDFSLLSNYNTEAFLPSVQGIIEEMDSRTSGIKNYFIPYFWGTWGIMYNKNKTGLEEAIQEANANGNAYSVLFDRSKTPAGTKISMYETPRYAYTAAMFYNKLDVNLEDEKCLSTFKTTLESIDYDLWGTDTLKKGIAAGNLDLGFMWTGDFLDMLYTELVDSVDVNRLTFDIFIPDETIAFMDNLVIPKKARHVELAHKFIDFMLDPDNAYENASVVGYCTPILETYNKIVSYTSDIQNPDNVWLTNWAYAVNKYYPILSGDKKYQGVVLANFSREYLNELTTLYNNAKV